MCNKIGLHKCGNYCLKKIESKCGDKSKDKRVCRFHFGEYDKETKMSTGKDVHPFNPIITRGEHPSYEGKYDHPRFLQHIKCRCYLGREIVIPRSYPVCTPTSTRRRNQVEIRRRESVEMRSKCSPTFDVEI